MNSRNVGPLCRELGYRAHDVDDGTLPRVASPVPRPIGMDPPAGAGAWPAHGVKAGGAAGAPAPAKPTPAAGAAPAAAPATIELPLDVYLVTLQIVQEAVEPYEVRVGKEKRTLQRRVRKVTDSLPSGQTDKDVRAAVDRTNEIWKPAGIAFRLRKSIPKDVEFDSKVVTEQGFFSLVTALKLPKNGLSIMFVGKFDGAHLGGRAVESLGAGVVTRLGHPALGDVLAHELGHLLGLPDLEHVDGSVKHNYNLMYEASRAGNSLTPAQIDIAIAKAKGKLGS